METIVLIIRLGVVALFTLAFIVGWVVQLVRGDFSRLSQELELIDQAMPGRMTSNN